jgi:protocatechuate 3,4-dioxygenase beta subunit
MTHRLSLHLPTQRWLNAAVAVMLLIGALGVRPAAPAFAAGTITGRVFQDFNANGVFDTTNSISNDGGGTITLSVDVGIGGVTVTAYDVAGANVGTATTDATGVYTLTTTDVGNGPYRIEFSDWPAAYQPSAFGANNGTNVQFASAGATNVNFALNRPTDYCQDNPQLATSCFFQGDLIGGPNRNEAALVSFPYSAGSNSAVIASYDNPTTRTVSVPASQIGATWGLGFARSTQRLYAAAFFKKHASFGPGGPGAIYLINPATNTVVNTFTVPGATRNSHDTSDYLVDNANIAWDAVGKDALGGLDLADDDSRLFVMNLENRTLYALDPTTGAVLASQPVPLNPPLPGGATCPAGDVRPFAVEYHNAQLFVGLVCSAESSQNPANLRAYVYTANPLSLAFSSAPVFDFALNYPRGAANGGAGAGPATQPAAWNPWAPTFRTLPPVRQDPPTYNNWDYPVYPQPMLTGLAFDTNGDMIIGLRDRFGDQMGNQSPSNPSQPTWLYVGVPGGDILRACALPAGGWTLESNGLCGSRGTPGNPNNSAGQGPGGGEFYFVDDFSTPNNSGDFHDEIALGGVAQVPGFPDVVTTMFDPIPRQVGFNEVFDGGVRWLNNNSGNFSKGYRLYNGNTADGRTFAKANGLGDLVALCNAAPIEIGNRVWRDANSNGVQDPDEPAISGATVRLYRPGFGPDGIAGNADDNAPLATAVTNASGNYYFSSASGTSTGNARYNINLLTSTAYEIRLDNAADYVTGPLAGLVPTLPNAAPDQRDSDGINSGEFALTAFSTGGAGSNNHDYDFGFSPTPPTSTLSLGNQLWFDADNDGIRDAGELPVINAGVRLYRDDGDGVCEPGTGDAFVNEQFTDPNGLYLFSNLSPGNYCVQVSESNFAPGGVLSGYISSTGGGSEPAPDPDNDVDNDDNGTRIAGLGVVTTLVTLAAGSEPLNENPDNDPLTPDANENLTVDFGFFQPYSLGNRVWFDADDDGQLDPGEIGLAGVAVRLLDGTGVSVLRTVTTGAGGCYRFDNLAAGDYVVEVAAGNFNAGGLLAGMTSSTPDEANPNSDGDSNDNGLGINPDATNGIRSGVVTLGPGNSEPTNEADLCAGDQGANDNRANLTVDFGFFQPAYSLGNRVWLDVNDNGQIDAGEAGVSGVAVRLLDGAGTTVLRTTTTVANGCYRFDNLPAGNYRVEVAAGNFTAGGALLNHVSSTPDEVNPNSDGDSNDNGLGINPDATNGIRSGVVTLGPGNSEPTNETDLCAGDPGAPNNRSNLTVDFGFFQPYSLGNRVWFDADDDGQLDPGEIGLAGVAVRLLDGAGTTVLSTTTTVANGCYRFDNLLAGNYVVEIAAGNFNAGGPLAGMTSSTPDEANPNSDGDSNDNGLGITPNPVTGIRSGVVTLGPGNSEPTNETDLCAGDPGAANARSNLTLDFGFFQPAYSLGNRVWLDVNDNGQIDAGEAGVSGVAVRLLDGAGNTIISTTTTAANGCYRFDNLPAGNYVVEVAASNFATSAPLFNYTSSTPDEVNPNSDGDSNDNGLGINPDATSGIRSGVVTLGPGNSEPTNETDLCAGDPGAPNNRSNLTVDFGFYRAPYSLGNRVWFDVNDNGQIDAGETGVSGVAVRLLDGAGTTVLSTTTTVANGCYRFDNLLAGNYVVEIAAPNFASGGPLFNYLSSTPDEANPNSDGDSNDNGLGINPDATNGIRSGVVTLGPGNSEPTNEADLCAGDPGAPNNRSNLTVDFGFYALALGNLVWNDLNNNGLFDAGEAGLDNVPVRLSLDVNNDGVPDGPPIRTTTTAGGGLYTFSALTPTTYLVEITPPAGFTSSTGANGALSGPYEPAPDPDNNADNDDNGTIAVSVIRSGSITLTPGAEPTIITATGQTLNTTLDFGLFQPASLGNFVWNDDGDGLQEAGETGVPNVLVTLYDAAGAPIITTTTDANGVYTFTNLIPGDYSIGFSDLPAGSTFTLPDQGGDDTLDSDANPTTGRTITTTLTAGENDPTWDAGLIRTLSLGNRVWRDANNSGTVDAADGASPGLAGVSVQLYADTNGNGTFDPALDTLITTTTTGATGNYLFTSLLPGEYLVVIPAGNFSGTGALVGFASSSGGGTEPAPDPDNDVDNDDNGTTFGVLGAGGYVAASAVTLAPNTEPVNDGDTDPFTNLTVDFGFYPVASLGNFVWHDLNGNGVQDAGEPGLPGVTVRLLDAAGVVISTTTTDAGGVYTFTNLAPGGYAVEFVTPPTFLPTLQDRGGNDTLDSDPDPATGRTITLTLAAGQNDPTWDAGFYQLASLGNFVWDDLDGDGVQDAGEPGLPNVTVRLLDSTGNVLSTTITTAGGAYQFSDLPPGAYQVEFVPPAGYGFSPRDQGGNDALDSDPDPTTGRTGLVNLLSGQNNPTVDAGLVRLAALGNLVWQDANANGIQDTGEAGVAGVTVRLLDASGAVISTTVTDGNGNYQFVNLLPGSYQVEFIPPAGQALSRNDQGGDDALDSDPNPFTRRTPLINLPPGVNDLRWDAGLHPAASVGQQVWNDQNGNGVREAGEPGVPNVTVRLFLPGPDGLPGTSDDVLVATAVTDSNGQFQFTGLPTGDYFFEVVLPTGFTFTLRDRGGNDDNDSDVDPVTGRTPIIRLLPGQNDLTWAAGLVASPTAVELLYFRVGVVSGTSVTLEWATATEINNAGFRLLRAPANDLTQAGEVAFVPAAGGGATGATYSHTDTTPGPGVWWYWLVDVDTNGTETVHGPVSSGLDLSALPIKIFLPLVRR